MRYINTKTGTIIDSPCVIFGGDWIKYTEEVKEVVKDIEEVKETIKEVEEQEVVKVEVEAEEEEIEGIEGITVKEIKQELDAFGIEYNPRAKKQELYDLMIKGR